MSWKVAFAVFRGNDQFVYTGIAQAAEKSALFLLDHAERQRPENWVVADGPHAPDHHGLVDSITDPDYEDTIEACDWNGHGEIAQRWTGNEIEQPAALEPTLSRSRYPVGA